MSDRSDGLVARTTSAEETRDLAAALAELARPSDLLVLVGDLGAGKTAFTQGFGRGLGIDEQITSPTFALVRSYTGRLDLYHLDVYRLEQVEEALDLGLSELLDDGSVTIIEWGDTIAPVLPHDYLEVHLRFERGEGDGAADPAAFDRRTIELRPVGPGWSARIRALSVAVAPWSAGADDHGAGEEAATGGSGPDGGAAGGAGDEQC
jgi:tRNA threonylcarbamoyladenosine biosynthesis protein TsaE